MIGTCGFCGTPLGLWEAIVGHGCRPHAPEYKQASSSCSSCAAISAENVTLREDLGRCMMQGNAMSNRIYLLKRATDIAEGLLNIKGAMPEQFTDELEEFRSILAEVK